MAETKGKKALSLCILRVLEQHAAKEQPLTTRQIIALLEADYGMTAERKAVGRNLLLLQEMGFELSTYQENGRGYYLKNIQSRMERGKKRQILLDAMLRAPLSAGSAEILAELQDSEAQILPLPAVSHSLSPELFSNLDILKTAIESRKQVSFIYNNIGINGELQPQRQAPYRASPYAIALCDGYYYVVMSISGYGKPLYYRCDLMSLLEITETPQRSEFELQDCENGLDAAAFLKRSLYQSSTSDRHELLCARHLLGELLEAFSNMAELREEGDAIRASIDAPWKQVRAFLLKNLRHATLLAPEDRRYQLKDELQLALKCYPPE
ncbi:MAG: WYL domain-containing protein [Clostridia bacterium]|nr:WYL domain-containing protein [Clostridia bacterium]